MAGSTRLLTAGPSGSCFSTMEMDDRIETISQLTRRVKETLESGFAGIWVRGEISNFRRQSSGHCYFSLKDSGSQLPAVLFRGDALRQTTQPRDGMQVVAYGDLSVYEPRGAYQMIVRVLSDDGAGRLRQEFEHLKTKLAAEGLFDSDRKQPLPAMPRVIGFITSPSGAAVRDFIRILERRHWRGRLIILPVKVQGAGAAEEMAAMLETAERLGLFDVLVIGRGGGSLEDLWAFNEELLVRKVAACGLPVISAVGHEIDVSLVDFAADRRAETPSAAAELISSAFVRCGERWETARRGLLTGVAVQLADKQRGLADQEARLRLLSPRQRIERHWLRLDDITNRLQTRSEGGVRDRASRLRHLRAELEQHAPARRLVWHRQEVANLRNRFERACAAVLRDKRERLSRGEHNLSTLSPDAVVRRGFAMVRDGEGRIISRRAETQPGQTLLTTFADGAIRVTREADRPESK